VEVATQLKKQSEMGSGDINVKVVHIGSALITESKQSHCGLPTWTEIHFDH